MDKRNTFRGNKDDGHKMFCLYHEQMRLASKYLDR